MEHAAVTIRPGEPGDAAALAGVQRAAALVAFGSIFPPDAPKPTLRSLQDGWEEVLADPVARVLVAADPTVIGAAALRPEGGREGRWLLGRLYVRPDRWGQGIGGRLHDAAVAAAAAEGAATVRLTVLEANSAARRMYERRGWRLVPGGRHRPHGPQGPPEVQYELASGSEWR